MLGEFLLEAESRLIVDAVVRSEKGEGFSEVILRQALHANQEATATVRPAGPALDVCVDLLPTTQVKVTDTEIRPIG